MIKVVLASQSKIKEDAVKYWLKNILNKDLISIKKIDIKDSLLPPQPINTGGLLNCSERIKFVEKNYNDIECDYIISIENYLKVENEKLIDSVYVNIKDKKTETINSLGGGDINITYKDIVSYPKLINCIDDLIDNYENTSKKYIFDGCEKTLGELINSYYSDISSKDWMSVISNTKRKDQILSVLRKMNNRIKY